MLVTGMNCGASSIGGAVDAGYEPMAGPELEANCLRLARAQCTSQAACKLIVSDGRPLPARWCEDVRVLNPLVALCVDNYAAQLSAAGQSRIDACVTALANRACNEICGRTPRLPTACSMFDWLPVANKVECAP